MSFNKALKFALEKFAEHPEIWISIGFVFILLVCFLLFKFIRRQNHHQTHNVSDSKIDDTMRDEKNSLATVMASLNEEDRKQQQAENMTQDKTIMDATAPLSATEHMAGRNDDSSLIDELRIPRQGEAESYGRADDDQQMPHMQTHNIENINNREDMAVKTKTVPNRPEKIAKFLGRKKRGHDEKTKTTGIHDISDLSANRDELIEIERKLLALRELHDAGLIATEIYLLKSREFAKKSKQ